MRELDVTRGDPPGIVRHQIDYDAVVDIRPLGVVVHPFGDECHRAHERKGAGEIGKEEFPVKLSAGECPSRELLQCAGEFIGREVVLRGHLGSAAPVCVPYGTRIRVRLQGVVQAEWTIPPSLSILSDQRAGAAMSLMVQRALEFLLPFSASLEGVGRLSRNDPPLPDGGRCNEP